MMVEWNLRDVMTQFRKISGETVSRLNFLHYTSVYSRSMIWIKTMCTIYTRDAGVTVHTILWRHIQSNEVLCLVQYRLLLNKRSQNKRIYLQQVC